MKRLLLILILCLAFPQAANGLSGCSLVVGMSQIRDLYEGGNLPGWMLIWKSGATLNRWDERHEWTGTSLKEVNRCAPDDQIVRVAFGFDPLGSDWPTDLHEAIGLMETRYPNADVSVFLLIGGEGHVVCQKPVPPRLGGGFADVRASVTHRNFIDSMPSAVEGTTATLGPDIDVACVEYLDTTGHLTVPGKQNANGQFVAFYGT